MVTGAPPQPFEVPLVESKGRVRAVRTGPRTIAYQDPDYRVLRVYPDGTTKTLTNLVIAREPAIDRLTFDYQSNTVVDSYGNSVGLRHLGIPSTGRVADYKVWSVKWMPMTTDPRRYIPGPNEEIVERVIFVDRDGKLIVSRTSWGRGQKYDRSKRGGWWVDKAKKAAGLEPGEKATTRELKRAQIHREFVIKTVVPRG